MTAGGWWRWFSGVAIAVVGAVLLLTSLPDQLKIDNQSHLTAVVLLLAPPGAVFLVAVIRRFPPPMARLLLLAALPAFIYGLLILAVS